MDYFFLTNRESAGLGSDRRSWLEWALLIFLVLGLLSVGVNMIQSWDDWNEANRSGDTRLQVIASIEKSAVEHGAAVIGLLLQAVKDEAEDGKLDQGRLNTIQSRYRPMLGQVEIAVVGDDAIPVISSRKNFVDEFGGTSVLRKVLAQPWKRNHMVTIDDHKSIAFLNRIQGAPRALNIIVVIPSSSKLFLNQDLSKTTIAALYDGEKRLLAIYPENVGGAPGQRLKFVNMRPGPTPDSHYATWSEDGSERLVLTRKVNVPLAEQPLIIEVGFASEAFLAGWRRSTLTNALGLGITMALLAFGTAALRRSRKLRQRLGTAGRAVGAVVRSLPLPVLLVDSDTGKINLSNESTKDVFGALSGEGEPVARLFSEPAQCAAVLRGEYSADPIPLLTRKGEVEFELHAAPISNKKDSRNISVITLVDVSSHQTQLKALRSEANLDALTGLANRHCFAQMEAQMVARVSVDTRPLAVLMIDIDFFKRVNDNYGHASGDRVLVSIAQQLEATLREHDGAFRLGGEEFCVTLFDTGAAQAAMVAERLRVLTQCTPVVLESGEVISVTCSIGVSLYRAGETNLQPALERADAALYRAKNGGRNRVELSVEDAAQEPGNQPTGNQPEGNENRQPSV